MMRIANQHNGTARHLCLELLGVGVGKQAADGQKQNSAGRFLNPCSGKTGLSAVDVRRIGFANPAHWRKADSFPK
jgi:hypothetical protein